MIASGTFRQATKGLVLLVVCLVSAPSGAAQATPRELAQRLFRRLTGVPLLLEDPRLPQLERLIAEGRLKEAAAVATDDPNFYRVTLQRWATPMSNRQQSHYFGLNDFSALIIGVARDNIDARHLLSGNFAYDVPRIGGRDLSSNKHFINVEADRMDLKAELRRVRQQPANIPEAAGLLTTRAWAEAHYEGGTNRRPVVAAIQEFLCTPIDGWKESGVSDHFVRRDVDRAPSGNPGTYQMMCRRCHAGLDAMSGAFARWNLSVGHLLHSGRTAVADKMNQNATVFPRGNRVIDDSWATLATPNQIQKFGWRGRLQGVGLREFGLLLANSQRFKSCLAERAFKEICRREPTAIEKQNELVGVSNRFETGGYRLRSLFEDVAILPGCLGSASEQNVVSSLARFQEALEFLVTTTGVNPRDNDIAAYYQSAIGRLPRHGSTDEITANSLMAFTGLSGMFCRKFIQQEAATVNESRRAHRGIAIGDPPLTPDDARSAIDQYARLFWQREVTADERRTLLQAFESVRTRKATEALLVLCASVSSSLDAIVR